MNHSTEDTFADSGSFEAESLPAGNLQVFKTGSLRFAILDDDIATVAEWRQPTPLPEAPPAVLGVVAIQGRMLTVLDPAILLEQADDGNSSQSFIVALRGDEQLALAVDSEAVTQLAAKIEPRSGQAHRAVLGMVNHQDETISVLDVTQLFALAIRGRERRRRSF